MTTLENRPSTALLVIDVQNSVVESAHERDACIRATLHGALLRGYDATLVSDAHTTDDKTKWGAPAADQVIAHTNLYWTYEAAPGRTPGTVATEAVEFGATTPGS